MQDSAVSTTSTPADSLARHHVLPLMRNKVLGQAAYLFKPTTTSTNADMIEQESQGAPHGALIVADCQTAGKGRHMRAWLSPPSVGLYVSILLRPKMPLAQAPLIGLAAAGAAAIAIEQLAGIRPQIKWPNDLLLNERKVAGILMESQLQPDGRYSVVVGLGVNVNTSRQDLPERSRFPASSIRIESGSRVSRAALLVGWLEPLESAIDLLEQGRSNPILRQWRDYAYRINQPVTVLASGHPITGTLLGTDPDGALLLQTSNGKTERILSGDLLPNDLAALAIS